MENWIPDLCPRVFRFQTYQEGSTNLLLISYEPERQYNRSLQPLDIDWVKGGEGTSIMKGELRSGSRKCLKQNKKKATMFENFRISIWFRQEFYHNRKRFEWRMEQATNPGQVVMFLDFFIGHSCTGLTPPMGKASQHFHASPFAVIYHFIRSNCLYTSWHPKHNACMWPGEPCPSVRLGFCYHDLIDLMKGCC